MRLNPKIPEQNLFMKRCIRCGGQFGPENFSPSHSIFSEHKTLSLCNDCLKDYLRVNECSWRAVDKICQQADLPFVIDVWTQIYEESGVDGLPIYLSLVASGKEYEGISWGDYFEEYKKLREEGRLAENLPGLKDERRKELKEKWGANYDDEALNYLENLFKGLMSTQNISGALQLDQAIKICKISYEIDNRITEGADFDKILASYDKLVRTAEFTPKNTKSAGDFETVGELVHWMEKAGFRAKYYNNVTNDIVDSTLKNVQNFNRNLYINESGIGDEISRRIEALKTVERLDNYYDIGNNSEEELDRFDNEGIDNLLKDNEEFEVDLDD